MKVNMLVAGTFVLMPIQLVGPVRLVVAWMMFVRFVVVMTVNRNWPFDKRIALVSLAGEGGGGALATITNPVMPAAAWPATVHW